MKKIAVSATLALFVSLLSFAGALAAQHPGEAVAQAARDQVGKTIIYDPAYARLKYPGGDVPLERGVCTDVVVRALRNVGVDLQVLIHQDMQSAFKAYPQLWGLKSADSNIDHRRVPNIVTYYQRQGRSLALPAQAANLRAGDLIAWTLPNSRPHIGVVSQVNGHDVRLVHNIGLGAREEAVLYAWPINAHLRPLP